VPPIRKEKGLEIKSFKCLSVPEKNQAEIVKRLEEGHTAAEVAGMFGLTVPQAEMILREMILRMTANESEIVKRFEEGHTPAEIAGMFDLTAPMVEMILEACMNLKQEEIWLEAIKRDHNAILEIPKEQWTEKLCLAAVKKYYGAIYYMSKEHFTKEICLAVHQQHPAAFRFVPKDCREIYFRYIERTEKSC
jgi:DNA-binding CsgD family transcriptional regulator